MILLVNNVVVFRAPLQGRTAPHSSYSYHLRITIHRARNDVFTVRMVISKQHYLYGYNKNSSGGKAVAATVKEIAGAIAAGGWVVLVIIAVIIIIFKIVMAVVGYVESTFHA